MRFFSGPELTYLQNRAAYKARILVWVSARNVLTDAIEPAGLWNGHVPREFTIDGETRMYQPAGTLLQVAPIIYQVGLAPRTHRMTLSHLTPTVEALFRNYETRLAPIQIHRALFDTETGALIATPRRLIKGFVDKAPFQTGEVDGQSILDVSIVTTLINMQRTGSQVKSDAQQRLRSGDRFRRYNAVSGEIPVAWGGGKRFVPPGPRPPRPLFPGGGRIG